MGTRVREGLGAQGVNMLAILAAATLASLPADGAKPVPRMQALPLPDGEVSFTRDGVELTRYYDGSRGRRPFLYPVVGPSGRSLTRMGHPQDPTGHSHHNSVWISHHDVDGGSFWDDRSGRIVPRRLVKFEDSDTLCSALVENAWHDKSDRPVLLEKRKIAVEPLEGRSWLMTIDLELAPAGKKPVVLGKTPFGPIGVRMAKSIGVLDGGGTIRNSQGNVGEQGPNGVFWKHARWVDYSGPITNRAVEGITLFDHPGNPNHPTGFHVRGDGWMGASLTLDAPSTIEATKPLRLRYGLYVHEGAPTPQEIEAVWRRFAELVRAPLPDK